jgi:hypothetical protein
MKRAMVWLAVVAAGLLAFVREAASAAADGGATGRAEWLESWRRSNPVWRGVHLLVRHEGGARELQKALPSLKAAGINVVIAEVNYGYAFESHPELRSDGAISKERAKALAEECRRLGIRLIPQFSSLGHQSWAGTTFPLLTRYPELDETPGQYPGNKDIYCRSWCPQHPRVNGIVFQLMDEILAGFEADAFHVGLDEVFLLASEHCSRCRGGKPEELFAKAVNDYHAHLVGTRKVEMLMWADRLIDATRFGYGEWEAAKNGTAPAINRIPKDIILCDWHYEPLAKYTGKPSDYASIPYFLEQGFRVWPCGWKNVDSTRALATSALKHRSPRLLGHLCSTWGAVGVNELATWPPLVAAMELWKDGVRSDGATDGRSSD